MHLDTDQTLLHHLVAADGTSDVMPSVVTSSAAVVAMVTVVMGLTLVVVIAMCVCHRKRVTNAEPSEPMLQDVVPIEEAKPVITNVTTASPVDDTDVKLTVVDVRTSRHSNGSAIICKEMGDNGRPKSHDQRALPEIPAGPLSNGVMQTDDEDDDEGHYDIISKNQAMAMSSSAASVSTTSTPPAQGLNLYEPVGKTTGAELTGDGTNNGADFSSALRGNMNPYATVDGIGSAAYAHIDEQGKRRGRNATGVNKKAVLDRVKAVGDTQTGASSDSLNESYVPVPPPPVPDKHFVNPDNPSSLNPNTLSSISPGNSPGLQLRNSLVLNSDDVRGLQADLSTATSDALNGGSVMEINPVPDESSTTGKREPPYSSVTARESLANLRQRQAIERQQLQPLPHDATYESVNYDQITSPAVANLNTITSDRNSVTSDLYAEIASGSGENSTRSSVYAKVGDVGEVVRESPAPTPPPMDFLKHLPKESPKNDDELPDPGYSIIRRTRPVSAYVTGNTALNEPSPDNEPSEGQPVYAVVDRSRRNRNTVCVSTDVNSNLDGGGDAPSDQMYAQVSKHRRVPMNLDFPQNPPSSAYIGTGARPKMRNGSTGSNNNPSSSDMAPHAASCSTDIDPAYQTIPSDVNNATTIDDPAYEDIVLHNEINSSTDFDPNYECVQTETMPLMARMTSPGVATEISADDVSNHPHGLVHINDHHVDATFWQRQEHVYQEIGTTPHLHLDHRAADCALHAVQRSDRSIHAVQRSQMDHHLTDHGLLHISTDL